MNTCQDSDERLSRTIRKIKEVLSGVERRSLSVRRIQGKWSLQIVVSVPGGSAHPSESYQIDIDGKSGLISVENAIKVAKIVADSARPDPKAMRILTEYLEDEWATFRLADVNREVEKYDICMADQFHVRRCNVCGLPADTAACVPCRKALARTLANLDVALALFVKEEVSVFRAGHDGPAITVNGSVGPLVFWMYQSGGYLTRQYVKDLCERATIVPYDDNGQSAAEMMQDHLNAGTRKAVSIRDETRKDMMSSGKTEEAIREAAEGKWCLSVQSQPHIFWNGSSSDPKTPILSTEFLVQGEASWPHCIDKDGNVSGDLLDTLYEFYERLREKDSAYHKIHRKDFVAKIADMFMCLGLSDCEAIRFPWGTPTKASILAAIEFGMSCSMKRDQGYFVEASVSGYAKVLSIFQDMFAPKDDSALWGSSCG